MDCFCGEYRAHTVSYMYLCCGLASVGRGSRATFSLAPHWNHWNHYHYSGTGLLSRWGLDYGTRGSRLLSCLLWGCTNTLGTSQGSFFSFSFFPSRRPQWMAAHQTQLSPFAALWPVLCRFCICTVRRLFVCPFLYIHTRCCQAIKRWPLMALPPA